MELSVKRVEKAKKVLADLSGRQQIKLAQQIKEMQSKDLIEKMKAEQLLTLPSILPVMQSWIYTAVRQEENKQNSDDHDDDSLSDDSYHEVK